MNELSPELSVVIAAFNAERTLERQLAALSRQSVTFAWEVLVCDNGSTDGTASITREWSSRFPQLVLVDASARRGPAAARNAGARSARSPLLAFCDADDEVDDGWVVAMHKALHVDSFVTGVCRRPQLNSRPDAPEYFDFSTYRMSFLPQLMAAGSANMGIERRLFEEIGGFDESLRTGEDLDLCWRLQLADQPLVVHPEVRMTVSNREGLRASFLQAFAYGRGNRQLRHKYARVIDGYRNGSAESGSPLPSEASASAGEAPWTGRVSVVRRVASKVVRVRRPSDFSNAVHRLGSALGSRFGSYDKSGPQLAARFDSRP